MGSAGNVVCFPTTTMHCSVLAVSHPSTNKLQLLWLQHINCVLLANVLYIFFASLWDAFPWFSQFQWLPSMLMLLAEHCSLNWEMTRVTRMIYPFHYFLIVVSFSTRGATSPPSPNFTTFVSGLWIQILVDQEATTPKKVLNNTGHQNKKRQILALAYGHSK